jgi:hypothetical protein
VLRQYLMLLNTRGATRSDVPKVDVSAHSGLPIVDYYFYFIKYEYTSSLKPDMYVKEAAIIVMIYLIISRRKQRILADTYYDEQNVVTNDEMTIDKLALTV